ncbi:rabenosyn-5 [Culicoides brevitarsis]|uniref:rabenosyn-5 n=1 Tax=Culicoides brevitarsis TaxID=469753 RepID=UPI00307B3751
MEMEGPSSDQSHNEQGAIIEGFLCPICKSDLKTIEKLTLHVESMHSERSQGIGNDYDHKKYFNLIRNPILERYSTETNTLIIRLNKLLDNRPTDPAARKQHEQGIVMWLDGKDVALCPECTKKFNFARRQHHCRLCGSVMCDNCSHFFEVDDAKILIGTHDDDDRVQKKPLRDEKDLDKEPETLRICGHCLRLLLNRKEIIETRIASHPIKQFYEKVQEIKKQIEPEIPVYNMIINSLYEGDSIYTIQDASALRGKILREAERIDDISKRILAIPSPAGSREESLKKAIRLAMIRYIKEQLMNIPEIPLEEEIKKLQLKRTQDLQQRIERERRLALEAYERYELHSTNNDTVRSSPASKKGSALKTVDNWSGYQDTSVSSSDPLVQQINIVKAYIKQAREAMKFEEVGALEINLRELQQELYRQQQEKSS